VSGRCRGLHHSSVQPGSPQATLRWPPRAALAGGQSHGSHVIVTVPGSHRCWARQASGKPGSPDCLTCPISIFKHIIEQLGCGPGASTGCRLDGSAGSIRPSRSPRWSRPYRPGSAARPGGGHRLLRAGGLAGAVVAAHPGRARLCGPPAARVAARRRGRRPGYPGAARRGQRGASAGPVRHRQRRAQHGTSGRPRAGASPASSRSSRNQGRAIPCPCSGMDWRSSSVCSSRPASSPRAC
jgi:hypothetical protein